jgi:putative spermidine/putrescine transport system ATP-binding protein
MPLLVLRSVCKSFDSATAADHISMEIASGEFVTLLGPSGCGKTTTLRVMAGLIAPDRGRVLIGGRDVTAEPSYRRNIGMVFQSHALFPHMTVVENVGFGLRMRGVRGAERRARAEQALEMVHLGGFGGRMPAQLSGGQQQRVALARAIVFDPAILLLDEPFGALDRKLREALQIELRDLVRRIGITSVFVTHDQEEALILSDRIAVMNRGRIEQIASPAGLFERPTTRFVADFMGFGNILDGVVAEVIGGAARIRTSAGLLVETAASGTAATPPAIGQPVSVGLRGERIGLANHADDATGANEAAGVIEAAVYQGAMATYKVRLDPSVEPGSLLVREATEGDGTLRFPAGARVKAVWAAESVIILGA